MSSYLSSIHGKAAEALYIGSLIQTRLGVVSSLFPIDLLLLASKNLLLVRIHQAEEIIAKRLSQGRNNVTELRVEPVTSITGRHNNSALNHSTTLNLFRNIFVTKNAFFF